jgi:hypothetical protein
MNNEQETTGNWQPNARYEIPDTRYQSFCKTNPISKKVYMNINTALTNTYTNEPRTMNHEQCFKTNPIKPNGKIGKMNATFCITKLYANEPRTMNYELDAKQTQSNPISTKVHMNIRTVITKPYANEQRTMNCEQRTIIEMLSNLAYNLPNEYNIGDSRN